MNEHEFFAKMRQKAYFVVRGLKLIEIVISCVYFTIPFGLSFFWHFGGIIFQLFQLLSLAKDQWRGFNTRNAHMVQLQTKSDL